MTKENTHCPLCGKPNGCMAGQPGPCWCEAVKVPAELTALVPPQYYRTRCICRDCIEAFHRDPIAFVQEVRSGK